MNQATFPLSIERNEPLEYACIRTPPASKAPLKRPASYSDAQVFDIRYGAKLAQLEQKRTAGASHAHVARHTVNEADKTITFHIATSSFPNWNGTEQKRPFTVAGDKRKWTTAASTGGTREVVLKREK